MDPILIMAKKYAAAAGAEAKAYTDAAQEAEQYDRNISYGLLLNYIRQHEDEWAENGFTTYHGTVTLSNSETFPFNNSQQSVAFGTSMPDTNYAVITQILSSVGNPGEIEVKDKLVNGFKLNCTGSANSAVVDYIVIGGFTA